MTPTEGYYIREIEKNLNTLAVAQEKAKHLQGMLQEIEALDRERRIAVQDEEFASGMQAAADTYSAVYQKAQNELDELALNYHLAELSWEHTAWQNYIASVDREIPKLVRFGGLTGTGKYGQIEYPALLPVVGGRNVLIKARGEGKKLARDIIQTLTLRLVGSMPAGRLRLVCIDPVGLGSTVAGFVKGLPDTIIVGGQAAYDQQSIEKYLVDLENHMADVRQKYLGVSFSSMEEYNSQAGQVEEPYRLLVIADFPARFTDTAAQRLISIATNGPDTGVYGLIMVDADQPKLPYGFILNDLERTSSVIHIDGSQVTWLDPDYKNASVRLDRIPPAAHFEQIVKQVRDVALDSAGIVVPYAEFVSPQGDWWKGDARAGIRSPLGQYGAREVQVFTLDEKLLSSALVVGKTGSGKSSLLHVLINGLAMAYSPEEIELYLLDFKQVEFKDYALYLLPHARVVAVKSEREFGLSVLRGLDQELQRRKDLFGSMVSLSEYRNKTGKKLPRILLVADEFQELFTYDDSLRNEAETILDRLVRQGRAFGINALLATQTLAGTNSLPTATKNQIPIRIALQCSDSDSRLVLSDENDRARLLERPGEAIYNAANGRLEGNNRFQTAWMSDKERHQWLKDYRMLADEHSVCADKMPLVFDGDALPDLESNTQYMELLQAQRWPELKRGFAAYTWLGGPIDIKSDTAATLRRQSRSNLMVVGQRKHEVDAISILISSILSLAVQQSPDLAHFEILNLIDVDSPWYSLPQTLAQALPHPIKVYRRRDTLDALAAIYSEMTRRLQSEDESRWPALYFVVTSLHKGLDLRREETSMSSFSFSSYEDSEQPPQKPPSEKFIEILREGPDVGIHTMLWCDTYANLSRILERRDLGEFGLRVALPMGTEDSHHIIDTEAAGRLVEHRALFYDEEHSSGLEKFRPYLLPKAEQIQVWGQRLQARQAR